MAHLLKGPVTPPLAGTRLTYAAHLGFRPGGAGLLSSFVPDGDLVQQVVKARSLGFGAVQDAWALTRPSGVVERVGQAMTANGLLGGCVVAAVPEHLTRPLWVLSDAAARREQGEVMERAVEAAGRLRSSVVVVLARSLPDVPRAVQLDVFAENLKWASELALRHGICLGLEPMQVLPGMLLTELAHARHVIDRARQQGVGLVFDTFHVQAETPEVARQFEAAYEDVVLLQLADRPGRCEAGSGTVDFQSVLSYAVERGYSGLVELEHDWSNAAPAFQEERLRHLRLLEGP